ncbi:hypothetical protein ACHAXT_010354 [Thalassiosira profunda]
MTFLAMESTDAVASAGWQVAQAPPPQNKTKSPVHEEDATVDEKKEGGSFEGESFQPQHQHMPLTPEILNRLDEAKTLAKDDKLLLAAHLLRGIDARHLLLPIHQEILREAEMFKILLHKGGIDGGWHRQGQHTGRHNFTIDYMLNGASNELSCRLETVIHSDLLVPILSVLNESELYSTWLPNYNVPRLRVHKSEKWKQTGRCSQVVNVETEVPWPLAARQVIIKAVACDNIDSYPEDGPSTDCMGKDGGRIIIRIQSLDCRDSSDEGLDIPIVEKGIVRMKVGGGFVIEKCPPDHPMLEYAKQYDVGASTAKPISSEDLVLVTFSFCVDPQLRVIPKSFINFFLRTAMGQMWEMFLNVAEDVKEGRRPEHSAAIAKKREVLYDWVEERTRVMLGQEPKAS